MSDRFRTGLFLVSAAGLFLLMLWGIGGLPAFGHYPGPYGDVLMQTAVPERKVTDLVTVVMFDHRGLDTLGEEFILFTAVLGVTLLLREEHAPKEAPAPEPERRAVRPTSEAVRWLCLGLSGLALLLGIYITLQAHISVGGGFQGGIIVAGAWLLIYLSGERRLFHRLSPESPVELAEASGAGAYVLAGLATLAAGAAFLQNVLPLGKPNDLLSGGTVPVINFAVGIEVSAAFILLLSQLAQELEKNEKGQVEE
jgi:multicomponent Na+:H+ antiporter subunit B